MPTDTLPPAPELFSRWGAFQTWWTRSNKEKAQVAEARLLSRLQFFSFKGVASSSAEDSSTVARVGLVPLSGKNRQINTLIIHQKSPSSTVHTSQAEVESKDQETDDQGRTPIAQTLLDIKSATDNESTISPPAPGERAIVVCHGYGAGLGFFYRNYLSLSQIPNSKIYAIDWLGMGSSSRPDFKFKHTSKTSMQQVVKDSEDFFVEGLEEWRQIQQIEKMVLVGHSLGGYLSAVYALKYPERVEKLILVSPVGIPENPEAQKAPLPTPPSEQDSDEASSTPPQTPQRQSPAPPSSLFRKLALGAWERNITPQSIMRFTGPFGPSLVAAYTSRRFAFLEEDELRDLNNYIYHISSKSGSGEYALATILAPGAYARWPLMDRLKGLKMPTVFLCKYPFAGFLLLFNPCRVHFT
ncbi:Alpha/Beta hydrolase protein [Mortierella sp. GBAus27b]|nr:Alpha/Beta hydrolase protein [Mortierella sp. GBAus27b]